MLELENDGEATGRAQNVVMEGCACQSRVAAALCSASGVCKNSQAILRHLIQKCAPSDSSSNAFKKYFVTTEYRLPDSQSLHYFLLIFCLFSHGNLGFEISRFFPIFYLPEI